MISQKITKLLNEKIIRELTNSYIYNCMSAYFSNLNLNGFEKHFTTQVKGELEHMQKVKDYMGRVQAKLEILPLDLKPEPYKGIQDICDKALAVEQLTTDLYNDLKKAAEQENDGMTYNFALEMLKLQEDEIKEASDLRYSVARIASKEQAIMGIGINMIDKDLQD